MGGPDAVYAWTVYTFNERYAQDSQGGGFE
jgi:hypothetical protein